MRPPGSSPSSGRILGSSPKSVRGRGSLCFPPDASLQARSAAGCKAAGPPAQRAERVRAALTVGGRRAGDGVPRAKGGS
jgi:hypothetical protein